MSKRRDEVSASDLESADLSTLSTDQVKTLKTDQVQKLSTDQVRSLSPEQFNSLSSEQLLALTPEQQSTLSPEQRAKIEQARAGVPTTEQKKEALNPGEVNLAPGYNPDTAPNQPLREKVPHYAPGAAPTDGAGRYAPPVGHGRTDARVPPENISVTTTGEPSVGPTALSTEPKPGQETGTAQRKEPDANTISATATPADVGLPRPELVPGLNPLPEEDPTPSKVPIPPPGPKRVA